MRYFRWIALLTGLCSFMVIGQANAVPRWTTFTTRDGLASNWVSSVFEDTQGNLWFWFRSSAYSQSAWVATQYDGLTWTRFQITNKFVISDTTLGTLLADDKGNQWVRRQNDVVKYAPGIWQRFDVSNFPIIDVKGNIWFEAAGRLKNFHDGTWIDLPLPEGVQNISAVLKDRQGNIWIGSSRGAHQWEHQTGHWISFTEKEGLTDDRVGEIFEDSHGNIWVGTQGGVNRYDGKTWEGFTTSEGLVDDFVLAIGEDGLGNLWFGTIRGVSKYSHGVWRTFTIDDRLAGNTVLTIYEDRMGNLWFGTLGNGATRDTRFCVCTNITM